MNNKKKTIDFSILRHFWLLYNCWFSNKDAPPTDKFGTIASIGSKFLHFHATLLTADLSIVLMKIQASNIFSISHA